MKYHVTYDVTPHREGLDREAIPEGRGACTAVLLASLLYPEDGSYSAAFVSMDGRTGEPLHDNEVWKAWAMLAAGLAESKTLAPNKRDLAKAVHDAVVAAIRGAKGGG